MRPIARANRFLTAVVAAATILAILAAAVVLFLNPVWVSLEQDRANAAGWTGYSPAEVHEVTGSVLSDLVFGPPEFAVTDRSGAAVFDAGERAHLRDVRAVFGGFAATVAIGIVVLLLVWRWSHGEAWFWRAVRTGARALIGAAVALGVVAIVAFDAGFEVFHRLFFAPGTYTFDPRTERMVQLLPDQFWSDTTIAVGAVLFLVSWSVAVLAGRRERSARERPSGPTAVPVEVIR